MPYVRRPKVLGNWYQPYRRGGAINTCGWGLANLSGSDGQVVVLAGRLVAAWSWLFRKETTLRNWGKIVRIIPSTVIGPFGYQCSRRAETLGLPLVKPEVAPLPLKTSNVAASMQADARAFQRAYVVTMKKYRRPAR